MSAGPDVHRRTRHSAVRARHGVNPSLDGGITLVEIVVAMFMLAIVLVAMVPLLAAGLKVSALNTTRATANQLASERMQLAKSSGPNCTIVSSLDGSAVFNDPRGVPLEVVTDVGACPTGTGVVAVNVTVTRLDTSRILSTASTQVLVR